MEIQNISSNRFPFAYDTKFSVNDIQKKFKVITKSSVEYNSYMQRFYQNSVTDYNPESNYIALTEPTSESADRNLHFITELGSRNPNFNNSNFMEMKFKKTFASNCTNNLLKKSKIKNTCLPFINFHQPRSLRLPLGAKPNLPTLFKSCPSVKLKTSHALIRNIIDIFYEDTNLFKSKRDEEEIENELPSIKEEEKKEKVIKTVKYFKEGGKVNKTPQRITKLFNSKLKNEMHLQIKPLTLEFTDIRSTENDKSFKLQLPFEFIPLFCASDAKTIIEFLSLILEFNNKDKNFASVDYKEENIKFVLKEFNCFSEDKVNERLKDKFSVPAEENLKFTWMSSSTTYDVHITFPVIDLQIINKNLIIRQTFDEDFIFFLMLRDFERWEYYTINYLVFKKSFRGLITKIFTKARESDKYDYSNFRHGKVFKLDDIENKFTVKPHSLEDNCFVFVYTPSADNKNRFVKIKGYVAECRRKCSSFEDDNFIHIRKRNSKVAFNLKQSILLYKLSFYYNLDTIMRKVFTVNNNNQVEMEAKIFESFDEVFFELSQRFYGKSKCVDCRKGDLQFKTIAPSIEWSYLDDQLIMTDSEILEEDHLKFLFSLNDTSAWVPFLSENIDKLLTSKTRVNIKEASPTIRKNSINKADHSRRRKSSIFFSPHIPKIEERRPSRTSLFFEMDHSTSTHKRISTMNSIRKKDVIQEGNEPHQSYKKRFTTN